MIPSPWIGVVLALATFRCVRLIGWDEMPWLVRVRNWAGGRNERNKGEKLFVEDVRGTYLHPAVAKFLVCPWCQGAWVSLAVYLLWVWLPTETLYVAAPLALSATVGLIAKNLDP